MQSGDRDNPSSQAEPESTNNGAIEIKQLVAQYVNQLLNGCKNPECVQLLCHTGRLNLSDRPIRKYTPRSARAIAITICSGPTPRKFICSYYDAESVQQWPTDEEGEYDTSSLMQLLCNTAAFREFDASGSSLFEELRPLHRTLDLALEHAAAKKVLERGDNLLSNSQLVNLIMPCVDWLLEKLPTQRIALLDILDQDIISKGRAFPQKNASMPADDTFNTWLLTLDVMDHELYLRLLRRITQVLCLRTKLERNITRTKCSLGSRPAAGSISKISIIVAFVDGFIKRVEKDGCTIYAFIIWLKKLFAKHWDSTPVIAEGSICHGILEIFASFEARSRERRDVPTAAFHMPLVCGRLSALALAQPYFDGVADPSIRLLDYTFLLGSAQLNQAFRTANHLTMREAYASSQRAIALRQRLQGSVAINVDQMPSQVHHAEEHYLLLSITRTNVLEDTFNQLWQRRKTELRRPLRVRLGQTDAMEVGHDLGGVQIEFFNLICREILQEDLQMFATEAKSGLSYFKPCSLQPLHMFQLFGVLFALATYNGITLPVRFPWVFYHILLKAPNSLNPVADVYLEALKDGWPVEAASLETILNEDVYGLDFEFPLEANGLRLSVLRPRDRDKFTTFELRVVSATPIVHHDDEGHTIRQASSDENKELCKEGLPDAWPGWTITAADEEPAEVTSQNKHRYVESYFEWLCYHSVGPQFDAFRRGFHEANIFPNNTLSILGPKHLKSFIEGTDAFDITDLKAVTRYDGYDPKSKYIQAFWKIVTAWPEAKQKQLLKFVTAAERIPITGVATLVFIIKRANVENLENLPTSSTCFGTLMLPKYKNADVLKEKLGLALKFGTEGFGTG